MSADPNGPLREVITTQADIFGRTMRMIHAGIALYRAVEDADAALIPDEVAQAAAGFRAVVEENA